MPSQSRCRLSCLLVLVGVLLGAALAQDAGPAGAGFPPLPAERGQITLASFNVENFFDRYNDHYTEDEGTDPKTDAEQRAIAAALASVKADFVGIVEVENEGVMSRFVGEYLPEAGYAYVYVGHRDSGRGINNGALSRVPIRSVTNYRFREMTLPDEPETWRFARDLQAFDIAPAEGVTIRIYVVHFKSKRDSRGDPESAKWRLAEAHGVRALVEQQLAADPKALVAVIGDFNDTPESAPIRTLLAPGDAGPVLVDVHAPLPADQRITYLRDPYLSTIDYIMVSPALASRLVEGSARVLGDETVRAATDHAAMIATFNLPEALARPE